MTAELRIGEGTERDDLLACSARVLDRPGHQPQPRTMTAERVRHLCVVDDDAAIADLAEGHLGNRALRAAQEIAALRAGVLDLDLRLLVAHLPVSFVLTA